ncbi:MAG: aminotransferase class IV [Chitinophagaceae bacterium]
MKCVCYNGKLVNEDEPVFTAQNRCFRYGDGLFETIKVVENKIQLADYHFDRLFTGLRMLEIQANENFTQKLIAEKIIQLCGVNNCSNLARVRLAVFRNDVDTSGYIIEAMPLADDMNHLNEKGFTIEIHPHIRKNCDAFANLKTANYLPYVMADLYARVNGLDECLVLNSNNKICDAAKASVFAISKNKIYTPALHQGCVNGVMRRFVINVLKQMGYAVYQTEVNEEILFNADEVFLTNATYTIRWVKQFRNIVYTNKSTKEIHYRVLQELSKGIN